MKNWLKKITGIAKLEKEALDSLVVAEQAKKIAEESVAAAERAKEAEELAKLSPKERATKKGEAWVAVLDTKVNPENIRNGFFELDWNDLFIVQLKQAGYGYEGDPDEEIVDRWFRDIVSQMLSEEGMDTSRGAGYINVVPIAKGKSEVS
jgi:hypothetical protein